MKATMQYLLEDQAFQKMLHHLRTNFNCRTIVLYRSRARGIGVEILSNVVSGAHERILD